MGVPCSSSNVIACACCCTLRSSYEGEITADTLLDFERRYFDGQLTTYMKSEPASAEDRDGVVKVAKGSSFAKMVMDNGECFPISGIRRTLQSAPTWYNSESGTCQALVARVRRHERAVCALSTLEISGWESGCWSGGRRSRLVAAEFVAQSIAARCTLTVCSSLPRLDVTRASSQSARTKDPTCSLQAPLGSSPRNWRSGRMPHLDTQNLTFYLF